MSETEVLASNVLNDQNVNDQSESKDNNAKPGKQQDIDLPKAVIQRIVKNKLSELHSETETSKKSYNISKDAIQGFTECAKVFISYLTATAFEVCKENKRQTIGSDEILSAMIDLDLPEYVDPLREALRVFKQEDTKNKEGQKRKQNPVASEEQTNKLPRAEEQTDDQQQANDG